MENWDVVRVTLSVIHSAACVDCDAVNVQIKHMQQMMQQMQSQLSSSKLQQQRSSARHANGPL